MMHLHSSVLHLVLRETAIVVLGCFLSCAGPNLALADDLEWTNAVDGNFNETSSWTVTSGAGNPPPGVGDEIELNEPGDYTITLKQDEAADRIFQRAGAVTLLSDNNLVRTLDLTSGRADLVVRNGGKLNIGSASNPVSVIVGDQMPIGTSTGDGSVIVRGSDSRLDALGTGSQSIGSSGFVGSLTVTEGATANYGNNGTLQLGISGIATSKGTVRVDDGATLRTGNINIATVDSAATGSINVTGANSSIIQSLAGASLTIGSATNGAGRIDILSGGSFTAGTGLTTVNATGTLNVFGGSFRPKGDVLLNGGRLIVGNDGFFGKASGESVIASNDAQVNFASPYELDSGSTFEVNSGADFITTSPFTFGPDSGGELIVDGIGTTFTAETVTVGYVGVGGANPTNNIVTIRNLATAEITSELNISVSPFGDETTDKLIVEAAAELTTGNINVGTGAAGIGTLTINNDASLVQTGASKLNIGSTTGFASGTVNVNSGQFATGTGLTRINATGTLNLINGLFTANGDVLIDTAGTLNLDGARFVANGDLFIDGGNFFVGNADKFNLGASRSLAAFNGANIDFPIAAYPIDEGTRFEVNSGSRLTIDSLLVGDEGTQGELIVDGMNSTLTVGFVSIGGEGSVGIATLRSSAVANMTQLDIGVSSFAGAAGTLSLESGAHLTVADTRIGSAGTINMADSTFVATMIDHAQDGQFNFISGQLSVAYYQGNLVNQAGTLAPRLNQAGSTTVSGDYFQEAGGTLAIDIGGLLQATEHDFVDVAANANIDGNLTLALIDDFVPDASETFTVFSAVSLLGIFDNVNTGQRLDTLDGSGSFLVHYGLGSAFDAAQIVLSDFQSNLAADFDGDFDVDGDDLNKWQADYGGPGSDADGDGDSDGADFVIWQQQLGNTIADSLASQVVPEPTALAILGGFIFIALAKR